MSEEYIIAAVRSTKPDGKSWISVLGKRGDVYAWEKGGVSIGSDPGCTLVLPEQDIPPVAGRVVAVSNHKLFVRLPPGTVLPLPHVDEWDGDYESRDSPFQIGSYLIRLISISSGARFFDEFLSILRGEPTHDENLHPPKASVWQRLHRMIGGR